MNFYYVRPVTVPPPEGHTVIVVPFRTTSEQLVEFHPMFDFLKQSFAWTTVLRSNPDSMNDAMILETMCGWKKILFLKQRSNTSVKQLIESCLQYARQNNINTLEMPTMEGQHNKHTIQTMCKIIDTVNQQSGIPIDVIIALTETQTAEIIYCQQHVRLVEQ